MDAICRPRGRKSLSTRPHPGHARPPVEGGAARIGSVLVARKFRATPGAAAVCFARSVPVCAGRKRLDLQRKFQALAAVPFGFPNLVAGARSEIRMALSIQAPDQARRVTRLRPAALAWYMALSARCCRVCRST